MCVSESMLLINEYSICCFCSAAVRKYLSYFLGLLIYGLLFGKGDAFGKFKAFVFSILHIIEHNFRIYLEGKYIHGTKETGFKSNIFSYGTYYGFITFSTVTRNAFATHLT